MGTKILWFDESDDTSWRNEAACAGLEPTLFFPEDERSQDAQKAKAICKKCPVKEACLEYALGLGANDGGGIWGETTTQGRKKLRRKARRDRKEAEAKAAA